MRYSLTITYEDFSVRRYVGGTEMLVYRDILRDVLRHAGGKQIACANTYRLKGQYVQWGYADNSNERAGFENELVKELGLCFRCFDKLEWIYENPEDTGKPDAAGFYVCPDCEKNARCEICGAPQQWVAEPHDDGPGMWACWECEVKELPPPHDVDRCMHGEPHGYGCVECGNGG